MGIDVYKEFKAFSDQPVDHSASGDFPCRYAYCRSRDPAMVNEPGQDYLAFSSQNDRFVFSLCDGVSLSFIGDLAAEFLGQALMTWFLAHGPKVQTEAALLSGLTKYLQELIVPATEKVNSYPLPEGISIIHRNVLEKKRSQGSQSTFIAGLIDKPDDRIILAWMGDSRLRLWDKTQVEITAKLGENFHTAERWSTDRGMLGELHGCILPASLVSCLAVYSDGLSSLDSVPLYPASDHAIQEAILAAGEEPTSDDISFLQIWLAEIPPVPNPLPAPQALMEKAGNDLHLHWGPVEGATRYEVKITAERVRRQFTQGCDWSLTPDWDYPNPNYLEVRAWRGSEPGAWSETLSTDEQAGKSLVLPDKHVHASETPVESTLTPEEIITDAVPPHSTSRRHALRGLLVLILIVLICVIAMICVILLWRIIELLKLSLVPLVYPLISNLGIGVHNG